MRRPIVVLLVLAVLSLDAGLSGSIGGSIDLAGLVAKADLIAIGTMSPPVDEGLGQVETSSGPIQATVRSATLSISQHLKGLEGLGTVRLRLFFGQALPYDMIPPNALRIFFLKRVGSDVEMLDHVNPTVPALGGVQTIGDTLLDRVTNAVSAVLHSPQTTPFNRLEALGALSSLKTATVIPELRKGLADPDETVRLATASALIMKNDISGLVLAERVLLSAPANRTPAEKAEVNRLQVAIALDLQEPAAVPTLKRLMKAGEIETRRAAAQSLAQSRDATAVSTLAEALSDDDLKVQYFAVRGLALITGDRTHTSDSKSFGAKRDSLVDYWKNWARTKRIIK